MQASVFGCGQVMTDDAGQCKGVGFVNYATCDDACVALASMHASTSGTDGKVLHVSLARDDQKAGAKRGPLFK